MAFVHRRLVALLALTFAGSVGCAATGADVLDEADEAPFDADGDEVADEEESDEGPTGTTEDALSDKPFVHGLFRSQMVLQRADSKLKIWGWAAEGTKVRVRIAALGFDRAATVGSTGRWSVGLGKLAAGGPYKIEISRNGELAQRLDDVMVGDVYLLSGQSNMHRYFGYYAHDKAMPAKWVNKARAEMDSCVEPNVRFWKTRTTDGHAFAKSPRRSPVPHFATGWSACTTKVVADFSALGYVMGRELAKSSGVAIGLVQASVPATAIECWLEKGHTKNPSAKNASRCFNTMIAPLRGARFKSVVWYQGEGNAHANGAPRYAGQLNELLTTWRDGLEDPSLPFAIVRLAPFDQTASKDKYWAAIQSTQEQVAASRNEATIVKLDADEAQERTNIHPPDKWEAGLRAAEAVKRLETGKY